MPGLGADVARLRGYLVLLLGSVPAAEALAAECLTALAERGARAPALPLMLRLAHRRIGRSGPPGFGGEGLNEPQRALNWQMRALSVHERALVLLGAAATSGAFDAARVLGLPAARFEAQRRRAMGLLRCGTAIVVSRQAIVALDLRSIVTQLGVLRVETAGGVRDLAPMLERHRPSVVIADTDGLPEAILADCLSHGPRAGQVPAVVISAAVRRPRRFPITLRKPFSSAALRAAVLDAIGA